MSDARLHRLTEIVLQALELYAWVGEDEHGSGEIGIKQGHVPAGMIPLVAIDRSKVEKLKPMLQRQTDGYGKRIYLVRFRYAEIVDATNDHAV